MQKSNSQFAQPGPRERAVAARIVKQHGRASLDYFKLWPDKSYYFSDSRECFLAYRVSGGCAVALADPVGPLEEVEPTIRGFMEMCAKHNRRVAFHQTPPDFLPIYLRLGFRQLKLGDEAIVDLTQFNLDGKSMKKFRHTINQLEKSGVQFIRYESPLSAEVIAQAREVSDQWLQLPGRRERGFTLGLFDADYLRSTPLLAAVAADGRMLAFVNLIPSYCPGEATIDLMRYRSDAPNAIMDYLIVKLLLDCKAQGFLRFTLGMAPMAGFREHETPSMGERILHYLCQHTDFLFSFTGLQQHKAKYADCWEPRYLIYRHAFQLPGLALALSRITELNDKEPPNDLYSFTAESLVSHPVPGDSLIPERVRAVA
ncbi:MAG: bifunctional lysylphosphatidylglycerol flippase/synthetase MprF [Blastocatellales bacterium]